MISRLNASARRTRIAIVVVSLLGLIPLGVRDAFAGERALEILDGPRLASADGAGMAILEREPADACLRSLLERAQWGVGDYEEAAWLVLDCDAGECSLRCQPWPSEHLFMKERWPGRWSVPRGAVAQLHTHPSQPGISGPAPSLADQEVARRLSMPIVTVAREGVFVFEPRANRTTRVRAPMWYRQRAAAAPTPGEVGAAEARRR